MIYYVVLYFIQRYLLGHLKLVFMLVGVACASYFILIDTLIDFNMYGEGYFKWFHFFMFMLMGAMMGISQISFCMGWIETNRMHCSILCTICF